MLGRKSYSGEKGWSGLRDPFELRRFFDLKNKMFSEREGYYTSLVPLLFYTVPTSQIFVFFTVQIAVDASPAADRALVFSRWVGGGW